MNKGFALDKKGTISGKSKNQLYKQYVLSMGKKPAKTYKEWLNIVKDDYPEIIRQKIEPISNIDGTSLQLNTDGDNDPVTSQIQSPPIEQFKLMGMSIPKLIVVTILSVGTTVAIVKTIQYYRKNKKQ